MTATALTTVPGLKEWGAVAHALLDGRQTALLRKGGIHERRFVAGSDRFVVFPTVAHSHAERVRPEHTDLLHLGAADVDPDGFVVRVGCELVDAVEVARPDGLEALADLHVWTAESVRTDRLEFRPKVALQVLVVRAIPLPRPVWLPRLESYGGCRSWVELPLELPSAGAAVHDDARLAADAARVRAAVA